MVRRRERRIISSRECPPLVQRLYPPIDTTGTDLLFQISSQRYERGSIIGRRADDLLDFLSPDGLQCICLGNCHTEQGSKGGFFMIESVSHKGLKKLFETGKKGGVTPHLAEKLLDILDVLEAATEVSDVGSLPGSNLHPLKGVEDVWSVDVTGNWRVHFRFKDGIVSDVDLIDPHKGRK